MNLRSFVKVVSGIAALILVGRAFGFLRETLVAREFGASATMDHYLLAYALPGMLVVALPEAFQVSFVPSFVRALASGEKPARKLQTRLILQCGLLATLACALAFPLAERLMSLYVQRADSAGLTQITTYFRLLLIAVPLATVVGITGAYNNARERYYVPALYPIVVNCLVLAFLIAGPRSPMSLCLGLICGLGVQGALQWVSSLRARSVPRSADRPSVVPSDLRPYAALGPAFVYSALGQTSIAVDRAFASSLPAGAVAALGYAATLVNLPVSLFAATVATVLLSRFSREQLSSGTAQAGDSLAHALRWTAALTLPIAIGFAMFAGPVTRLVFERGRFDALATELTAATIVFLAPTIVFVSLLHVLVRYLNVQGRAAALSKTAFVAVGANIALNATLVRVLQLQGVALSTSLVTGLTVMFLARCAGLRWTTLWSTRQNAPAFLACAVGVSFIALARAGLRLIGGY